ncbi:MAG: GtrA family protein [Bacteroidales bacterium]|nr:GtrA family protein [Bacteroidales bacterium]
MTGGAAEQIEQVDRQRGTSSDGAGTDRARLSGHAILVRYVLFAAVAGLSNLATQEAVAQALPSAPIMVSIAAGTPVGFLVKYLLDKRWVFLDPYDNHIAELRKIILYGIFGAGTTMLFCAIELSFWHIWGTDEAKYIGAAIGLVIGYWMKFLLDKKLVFSRNDTVSG